MKELGTWWVTANPPWLPEKPKRKEPRNYKRIHCPDCDKIITARSLSIHIGSQVCKNLVTENSLKLAGFTPRVMAAHARTQWKQLLDECNIESTNLTKFLWAERWVHITINAIRHAKFSPFAQTILTNINNNPAAKLLIEKLVYPGTIGQKTKTIVPWQFLALYVPTQTFYKEAPKLQRDQRGVKPLGFYIWLKYLIAHLENEHIVFSQDELREIKELADRTLQICIDHKTLLERSSVRFNQVTQKHKEIYKLADQKGKS